MSTAQAVDASSTTSRPEHGSGRPERVRGGNSAGRRRRTATPYLYLAVPALVFAALVIGPFLHTIYLSFVEWDGLNDVEFVGLSNYTDALGNEDLRASFRHALVLIVFFSVFPIVLALIAVSIMIGAREMRGLGFYRSVLFIPQVITMAVVGIVWGWIYSSDGVVNQFLGAVGLDSLQRAWLGDFTWALPAMGFVGTWLMTGFVFVLFLSGAQRIPVELYEACQTDGGGYWAQLWHVTLPGLRGEFVVALTLTVIAALRTFDLAFIMTKGGPGTSTQVPALDIYERAFRQGAIGSAAAIATILTVIVFGATFLIGRIGRQE